MNIDEILETREIHELITEIRDEFTARRLYRKEFLIKMDDIISCLRCISSKNRRRRKNNGKRRSSNTKPKMAINNK